jgi:hypothetical protein
MAGNLTEIALRIDFDEFGEPTSRSLSDAERSLAAAFSVSRDTSGGSATLDRASFHDTKRYGFRQQAGSAVIYIFQTHGPVFAIRQGGEEKDWTCRTSFQELRLMVEGIQARSTAESELFRICGDFLEKYNKEDDMEWLPSRSQNP